MPEVGRPSQTSQSSRKGKKAWRKNIDISEVEESIESRREELRILGAEVEDIKSDSLFQIDVAGDATILKKKNVTVKPLKADEILAKRSKVPALVTPKHGKKKFEGVSGKEVNRLMKVAGRVQGVTTSQANASKHGLSGKKKAYDVWGEEEEDEKTKPKKKNQVEMPNILKEKSIKSYTSATVVPKTLKEAPITVKELATIPHSGKSYNPSLVSWKDLINEEYFQEKTKEDQRLALEEYQERIRELIETLDDDEEKSDDDENESEEEKDEEEGDDKHRVSVNKPVVNNKKTRAQRNKQKRHQEKLKLEKELKELKQQITSLQKVKDISEQVDSKQERILQTKEANQTKKRKSHKLGTKYHVIDDTLEVKLSDELNDSLRKLKPEGNLLYDQMRSLQSKGKIETRLRVNKKRRYTPKVTEKWSYKDFK
ncbi:Nop53 protein [Saccharomycopsis crataegensis]|uniref:Ribosome biogenesis protein NOP53 n=1 Tax=Saccharomycopsis crataegensis TaxID=43959 RepID=A0AAV5QK70_9ASCO|nr:Nop53 protein [Saccharomycopsis crataegensis]